MLCSDGPPPYVAGSGRSEKAGEASLRALGVERHHSNLKPSASGDTLLAVSDRRSTPWAEAAAAAGRLAAVRGLSCQQRR
jgi:hypothetical protein